MENFTTVAKPSPEGVLTMPMRPERKLAMVALRDIGQFGAAAFSRPKDFLGEAIDLAGDELTLPEVVGLLTKAKGDPSDSKIFHWIKWKPRWATISPRCFAGLTTLDTRSMCPVSSRSSGFR